MVLGCDRRRRWCGCNRGLAARTPHVANEWHFLTRVRESLDIRAQQNLQAYAPTTGCTSLNTRCCGHERKLRKDNPPIGCSQPCPRGRPRRHARDLQSLQRGAPLGGKLQTVDESAIRRRLSVQACPSATSSDMSSRECEHASKSSGSNQ